MCDFLELHAQCMTVSSPDCNIMSVKNIHPFSLHSQSVNKSSELQRALHHYFYFDAVV